MLYCQRFWPAESPAVKVSAALGSNAASYHPITFVIEVQLEKRAT